MTNPAKPHERPIEHVVELRARLAAIAEQLGADELAALEAVAAGLAGGRAVYGELTLATDRRDSLVYLGAELVRIRRSR
jgi:hypothetical protein